MARNVYGLDLGTYDIKIFDKKKDRIWHAKNVIAMKDKKYIFSVGDDAYEMYEKAPGNIQIIFPMKNGVIARFDDGFRNWQNYHLKMKIFPEIAQP